MQTTNKYISPLTSIASNVKQIRITSTQLLDVQWTNTNQWHFYPRNFGGVGGLELGGKLMTRKMFGDQQLQLQFSSHYSVGAPCVVNTRWTSGMEVPDLGGTMTIPMPPVESSLVTIYLQITYTYCIRLSNCSNF